MKGRVLMRTFDELYEEYAGCISVQKSVIGKLYSKSGHNEK